MKFDVENPNTTALGEPVEFRSIEEFAAWLRTQAVDEAVVIYPGDVIPGATQQWVLSVWTGFRDGRRL